MEWEDPELAEPLELERDLDEVDLALASARLWQEPAIHEAVEALWPELTPQRLIGELLASPETLWQVSPPGLRWRSLVRPADAPWTIGDVPLLDEAAELLGEDDSADRSASRQAEDEWEEQERYAREVLETTGLLEEGIFDRADVLADRHADTGLELSTAERAAADRQWAYGHVIVDEAQELSAMAWRMVMRRVPARSLTVVGDIAQTGSAAGARSWGEVLDPYVRGRWREERLLVNYRTPAEIMRVAAEVLRVVDPSQSVPESVRDGEAEPRAVRTGLGGLPALVAEELALIGEGRLAVLTPDAAHAQVAALFPGSGGDLEAPVVVLTVTQCKGLEFDAVIVVEPAAIMAQSPMGGQDLYVAVTRATRRLTIVYENDLPPVLSGMSEKSTL
jgi:hypothetical protein